MSKKRANILFFIAAAIIAAAVIAGISFWPRGQAAATKGVLRVLVTEADMDTESQGLHRIEMPIDREQILLKKFAEAHKLELRYVPVASFAGLFPALEAGEGDLISANLAQTEEREKKYLLSLPFAYTREMLFVSDSIPPKKTVDETLAGLTGSILPGTSYVGNLRIFAKKHPALRFTELRETIAHDDLIQLAADGEIKYSVLNECDLDIWLAYNTGVRKLVPVKSRVPLVFAARRDSAELIRQLNIFIHLSGLNAEPDRLPAEFEPEESPAVPVKPAAKPPAANKPAAPSAKPPAPAAKPVGKPPAEPKNDLDSIRKRGFIRIITQNEYYCYFLDRGGPNGFEYELAKKFAKDQGLEIIAIIPPDFQSMLTYLKEGRGDIIAANYTRTEERIRKFPELTFCAPYCGATEMLAGRENETAAKVEDLKGRKIFVRKSSSYYQSLKKLQSRGQFMLVTLPENEETLLILKNVAAGKYDLTAADDNILLLAQNSGCKVKKLFPISEKKPFAWVVRKQNRQLAEAINQFLRKENKSAFLNTLIKRYYSGKVHKQAAPVITGKNAAVISPYDELFRKYGELYDFDWYFLAAQSFHESRFKPNAVSDCGAVGLMQVMPKTAREMGISDLKKPENGIHAGTKYMAKLAKRFPDEMSELDRLCFTLAAYNAGYGHIQDARILARRKGWNPNVWLNNTEKALALLETGKYAARAKYGFCRASETIPYVRNILVYTKYYQEVIQHRGENNPAVKKTNAPKK